MQNLFWNPRLKLQIKGAFQIVYKSGNNSHMNREQVIKELAGIVGCLNSENKVDLTKPQYTVVVEIIKAVCCPSVVKDYMLFRKHNLREVLRSHHSFIQSGQRQQEIGKKLNWNLVTGRIKMTPQKKKSNQQVVPEISEELGQTKPASETPEVNEGGSKPELAG